MSELNFYSWPSSSVSVITVERSHVRFSATNSVHAIDRAGPSYTIQLWQDPPAESSDSQILTLALLRIGDDAETQDLTSTATTFDGQCKITWKRIWNRKSNIELVIKMETIDIEQNQQKFDVLTSI